MFVFPRLCTQLWVEFTLFSLVDNFDKFVTSVSIWSLIMYFSVGAQFSYSFFF